MQTPKDLKKHYAPNKWRLTYILAKINSIKITIMGEPKYTKRWYALEMKRELAQMKKHIIFFEVLVDKMNKNDIH